MEPRREAQASLQELERLCRSAGLEPVGGELVRVRTPTPALYLGTGQTDRIIHAAGELDAAVVVCDQALSPMQLRNWGRRSRLEVYDRHAVILEIFSSRARTREAQLQVELARAEYAQSHLAGMWQHLSRQGGGSRLARGEGEKQIEMDRRQLATRVQKARRALVKVGRQRALRRQRREGLPRVALVGYTNAGKSTLMNRLTPARVRSADRLFATLDPTTRRLYLAPNRMALLSDTVGFVRRLPPELVNAFHSTLEEAIDADLLLLVLDATSPEAARELETTIEVLETIGAAAVPRILVRNKMDRMEAGYDPSAVLAAGERFTASVSTSATSGDGIDQLRKLIAGHLDS